MSQQAVTIRSLPMAFEVVKACRPMAWNGARVTGRWADPPPLEWSTLRLWNEEDRQRPGTHRRGRAALDRRGRSPDRFHRTRFAPGERLR